jgi:hypothetical protein|uniref:Uncharacterized protein n=1 Tax=viral metagenome TaxID=1070528 RepID=A0A6C0KS26_9ZZZZ
MYKKDPNGRRIEAFQQEPVKFSIKNTPSSSGAVVKENYEKPEGSNKTILYIALMFGLIVVAGSGYMIYKNYNEENKKKGAFGYSF